MTNPFQTSTAERIPPEYFFWLAMLFSFSLWWGGNTPPASNNEVAAATEANALNPFSAVSLEAKAAVVYDAKTRNVLFEKNATTILPLASIAKVMTAMTALSLVPPTTLVIIDMNAIKQEGNSAFFVGEEWMLRDLLRFMLLESSNDAAYAVAESVGAVAASTEDTKIGRQFFIDSMNKMAVELGLAQTHFENETGLDKDEIKNGLPAQAGAESTARETAIFFAAALAHFPEIFTATKWENLALSTANGAVRDARNTNRDVSKTPLLLASKTGFTDLAGGNLVIAFDADFGRPIIIVVLGSTETARFSDAEQLVWAALRLLSIK